MELSNGKFVCNFYKKFRFISWNHEQFPGYKNENQNHTGMKWYESGCAELWGELGRIMGKCELISI